MDRKKIYIIIIAVGVIFIEVAGFLAFSKYMESKSAKVGVVPGGKLETTEVLDFSKIASTTLTQDQALILAEKIKSPEPCFKIADGGDVNLCVKLLAQHLQSSKSCAYITDKNASAACSDQVVFQKAIKDGGIKLCSSITDNFLQQACVQKIVDSKELKQADCNSLPVKEKKHCLDYLSYLKDAAIFTNAKSKDECQGIVSETTKQFCLEKF